MEFKGTKGKWEVLDNGLSVFSENRIKNIAFDGQVCRLHTGIYTYKNNRANALLISKAPELLDALKHALEVLYECNPPKQLHETYANLFMNYNNLIKEATDLTLKQ